MAEKQNENQENLSIEDEEILHDKYDEEIQKFTLMSDTFMSAVFKDKECAEELLSVILDKKLKIIDVQTQYTIKSLKGRSVKLDIKAETEEKEVINAEVQNDSEGAIPERTRFHSSLMDMELLKTGADFSELSTTCVIMITKTDVLKGNKPIYHIDRKIEELDNKPFCDRSHIIYVNSKIQDKNTALGRLMHDMNCDNAKEMYNRKLADRVDYYKNKERGEYKMCEIMEKIASDREKETMIRAIKNVIINFNVTPENAIKGLGIPETEREMYLDLLQKS